MGGFAPNSDKIVFLTKKQTRFCHCLLITALHCNILSLKRKGAYIYAKSGQYSSIRNKIHCLHGFNFERANASRFPYNSQMGFNGTLCKSFKRLCIGAKLLPYGYHRSKCNHNRRKNGTQQNKSVAISANSFDFCRCGFGLHFAVL